MLGVDFRKLRDALCNGYHQVPRAKNWPRRVVCGTNLKGLGNAFVVVYDNEDNLLAADWCDRLIEEADVFPESFQCYQTDSVEGESDFCMNVHAAGKKLSALPPDMVLVFESRYTPAPGQERQAIQGRKGFARLEVMSEIFSGEEKVYLDRWNQVGGPELLAYERHESGCNILFADGHAEFVKRADLPALRWDVEGKVAFTLPPIEAKGETPFAFNYPKAAFGGLHLAGFALTLFIIIRHAAWRYWEFVLLFGFLAAVTGTLFGRMSEAAYLSNGPVGMQAGGIFGLLTGIVFAVLVTSRLERLRLVATPIRFLASVGMAAGIVCSTLVHLALIIDNEESNFFGVLIGIPFGAAAGALLGCLCGAVLAVFYFERGQCRTGSTGDEIQGN